MSKNNSDQSNKAITIRIEKIEITQVVQSTYNDIPLIKGKDTYVRAYINSSYNVGNKDQIMAELLVSANPFNDNDKDAANENNQGTPIKCLSPLIIEHDSILRDQRIDWSGSLNFCIPRTRLETIDSGELHVKLQNVEKVDASQKEDDVSKEGERKIQSVKVKYDPSCISYVAIHKDPQPKLHCRIVVFRHKDLENRNFVQATKGERAAIERYVESCFPVSHVHWSTVTVAAPRQFRALEKIARTSGRTKEQATRGLIRLFKQLLVFREQDIIHGQSEKTLYLGLLYDESGRFGGAAMDSPQFAAPHVVSIASSDIDGALGAHELAHVLGRRHPGIPNKRIHGLDIGQGKEINGSDGISKSGFLSNNFDTGEGEVHVGLDCGSKTGLPKILPYDEFFDLMTYRYPQWVSSKTYLELKDRLHEITNGDFNPKPNCWAVIGEYDLESKKGRIHYLSKSCYMAPAPDYKIVVDQKEGIDRIQNDNKVRLSWEYVNNEGKRHIVDEYIYIKDLKKLDGSRNLGVFQHTLTDQKDIFRHNIVITTFNKDEKPKVSILENDSENFQVYREALDSLTNTDYDNTSSLQLFVGDVEVDCIYSKTTNTTLKDISKEIFKNVEDDYQKRPDLWQYVGLEYSIDDGGYYLNYKWPYTDIDDSTSREIRIRPPKMRMLTSISCRKNKNSQWETISSSGRFKERIWVSPEFVNISHIGELDGPQEDEEHYKYGSIFPSSDKFSEQFLDIRVRVMIGFELREITLENICVMELTKYGQSGRVVKYPINCQDGRIHGEAHFPYPGGENERLVRLQQGVSGRSWENKRSESEFWYRDSSTNCEDSDCC
ncbi:MAG: hypothetical protein AAF434_13930 [Pseudomonadota bacterium]